MTMIYRCDGCGKILEAVSVSGSAPLEGKATVYVDWKISEKGQHLCDRCLSEWFTNQAAR
jgi:hypothetical protein